MINNKLKFLIYQQIIECILYIHQYKTNKFTRFHNKTTDIN